MTVLVVYNPAAGGGNDSRLNALVNALQRHRLAVDVYRTQQAGDATAYLKQHAHAYEVVVAVGGDGTTREVVNGLAAHNKLAVFATGTANVLSNELSLPRSPVSMASIIAQGHSLPVQFGRMNGQRFCMWVGLGFDAWVVDQTNLAAKRWVGKLAYVSSMLVQALRYGQYRYKVVVDGVKYTTYSAVITHARFYGGRFVLSRKASLFNAKLHVLLFQKPDRGFFFKALLSLLFGKMESVDGVLSLPFDTLEAALMDEGVNEEEHALANVLQADGDVLGEMPLNVALDSKAIQILVNPRLAKKYSQNSNQH